MSLILNQIFCFSDLLTHVTQNATDTVPHCARDCHRGCALFVLVARRDPSIYSNQKVLIKLQND